MRSFTCENNLKEFLERVKNLRKDSLYIAMIFIFLFIFLKCIQVTVTQNMSFRIFSTLVQALVALLALLGMVGIYRLQLLEDIKKRISNWIKPSVEYFTGLQAKSYVQDNIIKACKDLASKNNSEDEPILEAKLNRQRIKKANVQFKEVISDISYVRFNISRLSIWIIVTILISLIGLVCIGSLEYDLIYILVLLTVSVSCYVLILTYKSIKAFIGL